MITEQTYIFIPWILCCIHVSWTWWVSMMKEFWITPSPNMESTRPRPLRLSHWWLVCLPYLSVRFHNTCLSWIMTIKLIISNMISLWIMFSCDVLKDLSMMYRALWDRRHEGATRISQCTRRVAPSALTYPSGPWVPPISQCTIHHA